MVRTQIRLTEEQSRRLKALAAATGTSVAELIRQGIDGVLQHATAPEPDELRRRAMEAAGRFRSSCRDVAARHDDYLAEAVGR